MVGGSVLRKQDLPKQRSTGHHLGSSLTPGIKMEISRCYSLFVFLSFIFSLFDMY